jgi:hypothetical protein
MREATHLLVVGVLTVLCVGAVQADPMVFTLEGGTSIVLKDDGSWSYEGQGYAEPPKKDYTVGLDNGRDVRIMTDWTWRFLEEGETIAKPVTSLVSATARATAESIDVVEAQASASKKALQRVARKLKSSSRKKVSLARVMECVQGNEIEAETEETFTEGKGWDVAAEYKLDRRQILAVLDCAVGEVDTGKEGK